LAHKDPNSARAGALLPYIDTKAQTIHWSVEVAGGYTVLNQAVASNTTLQAGVLIA
jgi:superoxide dismutase